MLSASTHLPLVLILSLQTCQSPGCDTPHAETAAVANSDNGTTGEGLMNAVQFNAASVAGAAADDSASLPQHVAAAAAPENPSGSKPVKGMFDQVGTDAAALLSSFS